MGNIEGLLGEVSARKELLDLKKIKRAANRGNREIYVFDVCKVRDANR